MSENDPIKRHFEEFITELATRAITEASRVAVLMFSQGLDAFRKWYDEALYEEIDDAGDHFDDLIRNDPGSRH